jgi:uncharacterized membrane protein YeiH
VDFANTIDVPVWVNIMGIIVASATGAMYAASFKQPKLDLLGIAMIGISTGLGGGFLRDILLNRIPLAFSNNYFILVAAGSALVGMLLGRIITAKFDWLLNWLDAIALGTFAVIGTSAAIYADLPVVPALFVGVITAVGGGVIRDVMLNMPIAVMHVGSLYAVSALVGCVGLEILVHLGVSIGLAGIVGLTLTTVMRLLAHRYGWSLPEQRILRSIRNPRLVTPDDLTGPMDTLEKG